MTTIDLGYSVTRLRLRNLATNPVAVSAGGFLPNNPTVWNVTRNVASPPDNPQGITTAARSQLFNAGTSGSILSMYSLDSLAPSAPDTRMVGAWFYVDSAITDYRARIGSTAGAWVNLPSRTWTWVSGPGKNPSNNYTLAEVSRVTGNAASTDSAYVTGVTAIVGATPGEAFTGSFPAVGGYTYSWAGEPNASESLAYFTEQIVIEPTVIHGYQARRRAQSIVHEVLNRESPDITLRAMGLRRGTLELVFSTMADAARAFELLSQPQTFTLVDLDQTVVNMLFVIADGDLEIMLDPETRTVWIVRAAFVEVEQ